MTTVLVEVDVATRRPPAIHARTYTWLEVQRTTRSNVEAEAEQTAILMAMLHPHVVMAVGARVIDWLDDETDAQAAYEATTASLRRMTAAAWLRWQDLPPEARWRWQDHHQAVTARRRA